MIYWVLNKDTEDATARTVINSNTTATVPFPDTLFKATAWKSYYLGFMFDY